MEKTDKAGNLRRHLSQLKVLSRLLDHELDLTKGDEVVLDKHLVENTLDTLEIFIEDAEDTLGTRVSRTAKEKGEAKAQVTRLN